MGVKTDLLKNCAILHTFLAKNRQICITTVRWCTWQMKFVPSPIPIQYTFMYSATSNKSGRMQYHRIRPGISKERISRTEFIRRYNESLIVAIRPLQEKSQETVFQFEFFV